MAAVQKIWLADDSWDYAPPPLLVLISDPTKVLDLPLPTVIPTISSGIVGENRAFNRGGQALVGSKKFTARTTTITYTFNSGPATGLFEAALGRTMTSQSISPKLNLRFPVNAPTKTITEANIKGGAQNRADLTNIRAWFKYQSGLLVPATVTGTGVAPAASFEVQIEDGLVFTFLAADVDETNPVEFVVTADIAATTMLADSDTSLLGEPFELVSEIYANSRRITEIQSSTAQLDFDTDVVTEGTTTMTITCTSSAFDCGRELRVLQNPDTMLRPNAC